MSSRPILSRPRTRVYDANYNIGESYYKSALDRLDRKYSGRPLSPPRTSSLPRDILERHERAFADEDLPTARLRAEKHITEPTMFDRARGSSRMASRALESLENDIDEETASALKRIRANKKVSIIDDLGLENAVSSVTARRIKERSEKLMDSVGLNEHNARKALDEDVSVKRRSLRVTYDDTVDGKDLTKWSPIGEKERSGPSASSRALQSKARLDELEEEMSSMAERQAARERRSARLRAIMADIEDDGDVAAVQSIRVSRKERTLEAA